MSAEHNNTTPARSGNYNLSNVGVVVYFPIQHTKSENGSLQPFLGLLLFTRPDGTIWCSIDERWGRLEGMD